MRRLFCGITLLLAVLSTSLNAADKVQNAKIEGSKSRVVQVIKSIGGQASQDAIVDGDYNLVIQIIGNNIPPKQLESFLKDATDRQALAQQLGLTEKALQVFFKMAIDENVPLEDLPKRLEEVANHYHRLRKQLARYDGSDSIIKGLKQSAIDALSELDWRKADTLLEQAVDRNLAVIEELVELRNARRIDAAEDSASRAEAVLIGFQFELAGERYKEAANILPQNHDKDKPWFLNEAGRHFQTAGNYHEAERMYIDSIALAPGAAVLANLGNLYLDMGRYADAERLLNQAIDLYDEEADSSNTKKYGILNNLSKLYLSQKRHNEAEQLLRQILEKIEPEITLQGVDFTIHHDRTEQEIELRYAALNNLASLYFDQNRLSETVELLEIAKTEAHLVFSENHPNIALVLNNLAMAYRFQNNYLSAEPPFLEAIAIYEKSLGAENPLSKAIKRNYDEMVAEMENTKPKKLDARTLFSEGSWDISESGLSALDQLAIGIKELAEVSRVVVAGHDDDQATEEGSEALSEKRANAVRDVLLSQLSGIKIEVKWHGQSRPVASNETALGRSKNRRVEITILGVLQSVF